MIIQVEDCLCQAEIYSRDAFSIIVDYEMTQAYGNLRSVLDIHQRNHE